MFTYGIIYNRYCVKKVHEIKYSDEVLIFKEPDILTVD
jgi:hypothetical protein